MRLTLWSVIRSVAASVSGSSPVSECETGEVACDAKRRKTEGVSVTTHVDPQ
jgi:hypothetical protein